MFVLTPPSERTPLTKIINVSTYSSSSEELNLNAAESKATLFENIYFDCCDNVKFVGSAFLNSINDITYWKLFLFCLFEWNFYTTMKMLYPFNAYFASFYSIPITEFSVITASYDIGSLITILFILIPCIHFKKISIRISLFLIFIFNGIVQLIHTVSDTFIGLFILRFINGMLGALAWSQITGSIGAFLRNKNKRTFGVIIHESSSLLSTLSFVPIGYILYNYSINLCWFILSAMSIIFAIISCIILPTQSIYAASVKFYNNKNQQSGISKRIINGHFSGTMSDELRAVNFEDIKTPNPDPIDKNKDDNDNDEETDTKMDGFPLPIQRRNTSIASQFKQIYHIYLLYLTVILAQFPYIMFYVTFGPWLTDTFNLNVKSLGLETLTINLGELTALLFTVLMVRYHSNVFCVLFGSFACCSISIFLAILLDMKVYNEILILIIICLYSMFKEIIILNSIICTLNFSPIGYESVCSLIFLLFINLSSMIGTTIGPYIVDKHSFAVLSRVNAIILLIQLLSAWSMAHVYRNYKRAFQRRYSLSSTLEN